MKRMKTYMTLLGASIILSGSMAACGLASNRQMSGKRKRKKLLQMMLELLERILPDSAFPKTMTMVFKLTISNLLMIIWSMNMKFRLDGTILDTSTEPSENASASAQADSQKPSPKQIHKNLLHRILLPLTKMPQTASHGRKLLPLALERVPEQPKIIFV